VGIQRSSLDRRVTRNRASLVLEAQATGLVGNAGVDVDDHYKLLSTRNQWREPSENHAQARGPSPSQ
jgi:hypothetical protein